MSTCSASTQYFRYLDTWSGFEAAKPAPWPSRGLHQLGKFLEPSSGIVGRGCCCFFLRWQSCAFWAHKEWALEICRVKLEFFSFNTFDVSRIFWQRVVQPRPKHSYCMHFLEGIVLGFFCFGILCSCHRCFPVSILCPIVPLIFDTICYVTFQIYIKRPRHLWREYNMSLCSLLQ